MIEYILWALAVPGLVFMLYLPVLYLVGKWRGPVTEVVEPKQPDLSRSDDISVVVIATAIDDLLRKKLNSLRTIKEFYPTSRILIGLDDVPLDLAATRCVAEFPGYEFVFSETRVGKDTLLTRLHKKIHSGIVIMTDVDAIVPLDSVNTILLCFDNDSVGAVSGRRVILDETAFGSGQQNYTSLDAKIKQLEI